MAMTISEECINCGNCEPDCPNTAITQGESYYVIAADKCKTSVAEYYQRCFGKELPPSSGKGGKLH